MEATESKIATVVVRGATENYMDDIERAIDDGVNTYKGGYLFKKINCAVHFRFVITKKFAQRIQIRSFK